MAVENVFDERESESCAALRPNNPVTARSMPRLDAESGRAVMIPTRAAGEGKDSLS